jgi:hypothetical protein
VVIKTADAQAMASSARVLNLAELTNRLDQARDAAHKKAAEEAEAAGIAEVPPRETGGEFFHNPTLNRAVIIKHRLSEDDRRRMLDGEAIVGTKVFIRYNSRDAFDQSGKYMFLGEKSSEAIFREHFGLDPKRNPKDERDVNLLRILHKLPSLDPFLLRDRLLREDFGIDESYFRLSRTESEKLRSQVIREFYPLAESAFKNAGDISKLSGLIVDKMWEATDLRVLKPMMDAMEIEFSQAGEIFFAWKGFVYYKLMLARLSVGFAKFITGLNAAQPVNLPTDVVKQEIEVLRPRVAKGLRTEYEHASKQIEEYNHAYRHEMIRLGQPKNFTAFLRNAPRRFERMGASVAAIDHAQTMWLSRFGNQKTPFVPGLVFLDILRDFADGLPA